jgi:hemerythrin-like domain-containing protein
MALFTRKSRTEGVSDPARLLIDDHMKVEKIFEQIKNAESPNQCRGLLTQLDAELTRHTTIEENVLYPFVEDHLGEGQKLIDEAEKEHEEASQLLERVANMDPSAADFMDHVKALEQAVQHHVKEEENELFPKLEKATDEATLTKLRLDLENEKLGLAPSPNLGERGTGVVRGGQAKARTTASSGVPDVWVQPHPKDDRWQVKREGATRASRVFDTQAEAEQFGRRLAQRERVELVVAGRDGTIRDRSSFGNDPSRIPG